VEHRPKYYSLRIAEASRPKRVPEEKAWTDTHAKRLPRQRLSSNARTAEVSLGGKKSASKKDSLIAEEAGMITRRGNHHGSRVAPGIP
jgi:hypothetical protein